MAQKRNEKKNENMKKNEKQKGSKGIGLCYAGCRVWATCGLAKDNVCSVDGQLAQAKTDARARGGARGLREKENAITRRRRDAEQWQVKRNHDVATGCEARRKQFTEKRPS